MTPIITTPRLTLRLPRKADAEAVRRHLDDFGVAGNLVRVPHPYLLTDAKAWLATRHPSLPPTETSFAMDLADDFSIGTVGFHLNRQGPVIGYWLGRPYWGQGLMTEAARAAVGWFFDSTIHDTLYSGVFHFNAASLAIQRKLGFVEIGRSTMPCLARGEEVEHIDTQLTRSAWMARS